MQFREHSLLFLLFLTQVSCKEELLPEREKKDLLEIRLSERLKTIFEDEIRKFEYDDSISMPDSGAILFTGSSSIKLWDDLEKDMMPLTVINRGFGGSILEQLPWYAHRIIFPYRPKAIVIYAGENDIANDKVPARQPYISFIKLHLILRDSLPDTHIFFISLKPSPKRQQWTAKFTTANELIKKYIGKHEKMTYIDVSEAMRNATGEIRNELFLPDSLHLNSKGYALWTGIIKSELIARYPRQAGKQ